MAVLLRHYGRPRNPPLIGLDEGFVDALERERMADHLVPRVAIARAAHQVQGLLQMLSLVVDHAEHGLIAKDQRRGIELVRQARTDVADLEVATGAANHLQALVAYPRMTDQFGHEVRAPIVGELEHASDAHLRIRKL